MPMTDNVIRLLGALFGRPAVGSRVRARPRAWCTSTPARTPRRATACWGAGSTAPSWGCVRGTTSGSGFRPPRNCSPSWSRGGGRWANRPSSSTSRRARHATCASCRATHGGDDLVIVCHDRDPRQVMHGRKLAADEGLQRFTFSVGDATDESSYLTSQDPDIAARHRTVPVPAARRRGAHGDASRLQPFEPGRVLRVQHAGKALCVVGQLGRQPVRASPSHPLHRSGSPSGCAAPASP